MTKTLADMAQRELETLMGVLTAELTDLNAVRRRKAAHINSVQEELTRRKEDKNFRPSITDHAVLRYLERVMGVDVESLRGKLLSPGLLSALRSGATKYTQDGVTYLLRDNAVITIVDR